MWFIIIIITLRAIWSNEHNQRGHHPDHVTTIVIDVIALRVCIFNKNAGQPDASEVDGDGTIATAVATMAEAMARLLQIVMGI